MGRKSKFAQLPAEIREKIADLHHNGRTLDQIMAKLAELDVEDVSRSGLHRHVKGLDKITERLRRSRHIAESLVKKFGSAPENKVMRLNIEMMHGVIMDIISQVDDNEGGGAENIILKPADAMFLAKSLDHLAKAARYDADSILAERAEAAKVALTQAAEAVDTMARKNGLTQATVQAIRDRILGNG